MERIGWIRRRIWFGIRSRCWSRFCLGVRFRVREGGMEDGHEDKYALILCMKEEASDMLRGVVK